MSIIKKPALDSDAMTPKDENVVTPRPGEEAMESIDVCASPYEDFRSGASWRIFRIMAEFIEGFEFLADLKKEVSIFGSARLPATNHWYKESRDLGRLLGHAGFTVITGGGPGIMEAGNRGAFESGGVSVGLNIQLPNEQRINRYVKKSRAFHYFFTRKVMLTVSSQAYVYFPGGFGTLDEFFEIVTLVQTKKMCKIPIVCVGKEFWQGIFKWVSDEMVPNGYIDPADLKLVHIVDTAKEAFHVLKDSEERTYF